MKLFYKTSLLLFISCVAAAQVKVTSSMFGALETRQIGPATMSGRITAIDAISKNTRILYVGTAGGGVWKSTTAGVSFKPVFDKYCQSIGALVIDQKNPETVWVGTGESNMRNSVSVGTGIYRTNDGGSNWKLMGLDSVEHISKIIIDPNNSDIVYVACPGPLWSDSKQRGLYKTTDGGKTWVKIWYVNEKTGCADIVMDPKNPQVLYASAWQFRRTPWSFSSGGPGSGLFKSTDAGKTWTKIQNGFDGQELGRICLAISPSDGNKLYCIAESAKTALYSSSDGGANWVKKSSGMNVTWRPFYFSVIVVDPTDPQRIYRPSLELSISSDGGESFKEASFEGGWVHSDHHALWVNPNNNQHLLLGTDGGVYQSLDRGNSWTMFGNLPVSQFYHVAADMQTPYNVYGGLQDNGSWFAPSQSVGGIENKDWTNCGGGDGFWVQPDLSDPNILYSESQGGTINRFNKSTNEYKGIKPYALAGESKLRLNWNTPIVTQSTNPNTIYFGAQYLYRSKNKGDTWERISPDLTTNDQKKMQQEKSGGLSVDNSGAENHCTIFSICESPLDANTIWAGTDDGNVQVTTDGGKTWTNVAKNITAKGLPANTWCSSIDASKFDKNTVFATFEGHATGDMKTYIYKSTDLGKTWAKISTDDVKGFAHKIKQDIVNPDLLFAGTEFGLYVTLDGGKNWFQYKANMPSVAVRDIQIQPTTNDLVMATHGRGIIILDDITPLRNFLKLVDTEMNFVPTRPYYLTQGKFGGAWPNGGYSGPNSDEEYMIMYYLKDRVSSGKVEIEIYDANGTLLKTLPGTKRRGINKVTWDMRQKPPRVASGVKVDFSGFYGPMITEGIFTVKLNVNGKIIENKIDIKADPLSPYSSEERKLQQQTVKQIIKMQEDLAFLSDKLKALKESCGSVNAEKNKELQTAIANFNKKITAVMELLAASIEGTAITGEEKIREKISEVYYGVSSFDGKPTDSHLDRIKGLQKELDDANKKAEDLFAKDLVTLNALLTKNKLDNLKVMTWEEWDAKTKKK